MCTAAQVITYHQRPQVVHPELDYTETGKFPGRMKMKMNTKGQKGKLIPHDTIKLPTLAFLPLHCFRLT